MIAAGLSARPTRTPSPRAPAGPEPRIVSAARADPVEGCTGPAPEPRPSRPYAADEAAREARDDAAEAARRGV